MAGARRAARRGERVDGAHRSRRAGRDRQDPAALDAAQAMLLSVMRPAFGRDTRAALSRTARMSAADARRADQVAQVCAGLDGAAAALAAGQVTAAHLALLQPLLGDPAAPDLLAVAMSEGPDDFARTVQRHQVVVDTSSREERQRRARTLQFSPTEDGGLRLRCVLTQLDGERLRAAVEARCDEAWRAAHPDRARVLGGHDAEPRDRRLADALVDLVCGRAGGSVRTAVVVVVDEPTMTASTVTGDPVSLDAVGGLCGDARTDLYAAVRDMNGAILRFGRSRRLASPLQRLALAVRDGGRCGWPGCESPWSRCDADHRIDWELGGLTDLENLQLLCGAHHAHRHETGRQPDRPDPPDTS